MLWLAGRARVMTGLALAVAANVGCSDGATGAGGSAGASGGSVAAAGNGGGGSQNVAGGGTAGTQAEVKYSPSEVRWIYPLPETVRPVALVGADDGVLAAGDDTRPLDGTPWFIELSKTGESAREVRIDADGPGVANLGIHEDGTVSLVGAVQLLPYTVAGQAIPAGGSYVASVPPGGDRPSWVQAIDTGRPTNPYVNVVVGGGESLVLGGATGAVSVAGQTEGEDCPEEDFGSHAMLLGPGGALRWLKVYCTGVSADVGVMHPNRTAAVLLVNQSGTATATEPPPGLTLLSVDTTGAELSRTALLSSAASTYGKKAFALDDLEVGLWIRSGTAVDIGPLSVPADGDGLLVVGADGALESGFALPAGTEDVVQHPSGDWIVAGKLTETKKYVVRLGPDGTQVWRREFGVEVPLAVHSYRGLEINVATDKAGQIYFRLATGDFDTYDQEHPEKRLSNIGFYDVLGAIEP
jgi:hypothetical protein